MVLSVHFAINRPAEGTTAKSVNTAATMVNPMFLANGEYNRIYCRYVFRLAMCVLTSDVCVCKTIDEGDDDDAID